MPKISEEKKHRQGRGKGHGANYKPWILTREVNSIGTTANIVDWKHGRTTQLLSQGEEWYYYIFRWDDHVTDIREQFPLDLDKTVDIAHQFGIRHPHNNSTTMTTDMLIDYDNGRTIAVSVKSSMKDVDYMLCETAKEQKEAKRTAEKLLIEKMYWNNEGNEWELVYKEDLNPMFVNNIRRVVLYYNAKDVHDNHSYIKYLIATKQITVDMNKPIDYEALIHKYI